MFKVSVILLKRFITLILAVFMCFMLFNSMQVEADDINEDSEYVQLFPETDIPVLKTQMPKLDATNAIVMDMKTGRVLYEKHAYVKKAMASTTKIMTAIITLEKGNLEEVVTVSKKAAGIWGSSINLKAGEQLKLGELLYGLMLKSGNDAAIAIAEHIGGSVEGFCEMMNQKALDLGAENTRFTSPHGLDMPDHYTTAYDLALITRYALNNPVFSKIVSTENINVGGRAMHNTNEMLGAYQGADGVKTGYTGQAGRCLVASATRDNRRLISVVLGSPSRNARAQSSKNILDYAFNNYSEYTLLEADEIMGKVSVKKGIDDFVHTRATQKIVLPLRKDEYDAIQRQVDMKETINPPVAANIEVGKVHFILDGKVIAESPIVTCNDVRRKTFFDYFYDIIYEWGKIMK